MSINETLTTHARSRYHLTLSRTDDRSQGYTEKVYCADGTLFELRHLVFPHSEVNWEDRKRILVARMAREQKKLMEEMRILNEKLTEMEKFIDTIDEQYSKPVAEK